MSELFSLSVIFFLVCTNYVRVLPVDISSDLENWMTKLPDALRTTPIIHLAIPGSHDSGTFGITNTSEIAPDADDAIKDLSFLGPLLLDIMARWSLTQPYSIKDQLTHGIRYLDFRIATKENTDQFYFVHGLYSAEVSKVLTDINDFLDAHPKEVVGLDCQHFYALGDSDHQRFKNLLISTFGQKLLPFTNDLQSVSLDSMSDHQYQVFAIYREGPPNLENTFWPSSSLPNPWADTVSAPDLINFLSDGLKNRDNSIGYVSQCILTPSTSTILQHLAGDLKSQCFDSLEGAKYEWLNSLKPGPGGVNVIISDFVDYKNDEFAKAVIQLNQKLL